ncbi:hypothetical protein ACWEN3_08120 [Streptomyces sp. NPDC004561]
MPSSPLPGQALPAALAAVAMTLVLAAGACSADRPSPSGVTKDWLHAAVDLDRAEVADLSCSSLRARVEDDGNWREMRAGMRGIRFAAIDVTKQEIDGRRADVTYSLRTRNGDGATESRTRTMPVEQDLDGNWKVCAGHP